MASNNRSHYTPVFSAWSTKSLGPQPTEAQLAIAHVFGRPGKQSLAVAMALRDCGMTSAAMTSASALFDGKATPHRNHIKAKVESGEFKREPMLGGGIKLSLTAKGKAWVEKAADADKATPKVTTAKATTAPATNGKGKAARKAARKAKVKAATAATVDAPVTSEPVASEPVADQPAAS